VDTSLSGLRVTRVLDQIIAECGMPNGLRLDNGPEFTSRCFIGWAEQRGVPLIYIQPGKPVQNSYIESFNGRFRDECLNANWFENLADARRKIEAWRLDYNQARPHSSLAYRTPEEFARAWTPSPSLIVVEQSEGGAGRRTEYDQPKGILVSIGRENGGRSPLPWLRWRPGGIAGR